MDLVLILMIILIPLIAEFYVNGTYKKYLKRECSQKLCGQEVARMILDQNGLQDVYVVKTNGTLSDHYDPKRKVVRLSEAVYSGETISSLAIAAHECGHAIQDKEGYLYMRFRSFIFPFVNIATSLSYWIICIGFIFELLDMVYIGIGLTCFGLLFQIVTLPVEFDASKRARQELNKLAIVNEEESDGVKQVLVSAALTYVAGVLASALQILRLILVANDRD